MLFIVNFFVQYWSILHLFGNKIYITKICYMLAKSTAFCSVIVFSN